MANFTGVLIKTDFFVFVGENVPGTISGTVTKAALPQSRKVLLYQDPNPDLLDITPSDPGDGSFSFPVSFAGPSTKYTLVCKGDSDANENDTIFTDVTAKLD